MTSIRKMQIIIAFAFVLCAVGFAAAQNHDISETSLTPLSDDRLPGVEMLSEEALLGIALEEAQAHSSQQLNDALPAVDLQTGEPIYALYRDLVAFEGDDPEPEPGMLGAEDANRPIMIVTISNGEFVPFPSPPIPPDDPSSASPYTAMFIILFADNGQVNGRGFVPEGVAVPDYSALPGYASAPLPPASPDLIPLPSAPDPNSDTRGTS